LLVDADGIVSRSIKLALTYDGHRTRTAGDDKTALAMLKRVKFDLLIVDRALVGILGNDLAARIKQRWPDLPVIMTSAFALDFNLSGTTFKNVDYVLSKTFALTELRDAIDHVFFGKRSRSLFPVPVAAPAGPRMIPPPYWHSAGRRAESRSGQMRA
jgi:DNA-binding response OmpR family regulator